MQAIHRRSIGLSKLEISTLGFGGTGLVATTDDEAHAAIGRALGLGLRYFDTAPAYGKGMGERRMGRALQQSDNRDYVISTKVGRLLRFPGGAEAAPPADAFPELVFDYSYDGAMKSVEESLERLGLDCIDLLILHDLSPRWHGSDLAIRYAEAMNGAYRALERLRVDGTVAAIGLGVNDCAVCLRSLTDAQFDFFMLAGRYTLLDQEALAELLPRCVERSIGVIAAAPFNSGILATGVRPGATYFYAPPPPDIIDRTRRVERVCGRHGVPLPAAAIQFAIGHPAVACVLPGPRTANEVEENRRWMEFPIPGDLWEELKTEGLLRKDAPLPAPRPGMTGDGR